MERNVRSRPAGEQIVARYKGRMFTQIVIRIRFIAMWPGLTASIDQVMFFCPIQKIDVPVYIFDDVSDCVDLVVSINSINSCAARFSAARLEEPSAVMAV